jgi:hypothetical protein
MKWIYLQALGIWVLLAVVAIINGSLRNYTYGKYLSDLTAHQLSCLTGFVLFALVYYIFFKFTKAEYSKLDFFLIGSMWIVMTILFEFVFGHYVIGHSWEKLFADCNIFKGRLWILILLWTWLGPLIIGSVIKGYLNIPFLTVNKEFLRS